jgi:predicted MPP superfamily phosphohydrolase
MAPTKIRKRRLRYAIGLAVALLLGIWLALTAWHDTMAEPVVRRATIELPGMADDAKPLTIALLSDIHVADPDMSPSRLAHIVTRVNALHPDVVVMAGDFVSEKQLAARYYSIAESIAPLGGLRPKMGAFAVLGNHDQWSNAGGVRRELVGRGVTVLSNEARQVGPVAIGGLDDFVTGHARLSRTLAAMRKLHGGRIVLSHSPDPFARLPADTGLMLAGHTHCGQIRLFGWAPVTNSRYGRRYVCGLVRERGNLLVVTAGLGTSVVPVRVGAVPDIWLIALRPPAATKRPPNASPAAFSMTLEGGQPLPAAATSAAKSLASFSMPSPSWKRT